MIDVLMIVVRWLAGFRFGGAIAVASESFLPPARAVCGLRREGNRAVGAFPDIGWMTVRLDSVLCVRVLSDSSPLRPGSTALCVTPRCGGV
jgi:hypothetical protein